MDYKKHLRQAAMLLVSVCILFACSAPASEPDTLADGTASLPVESAAAHETEQAEAGGTPQNETDAYTTYSNYDPAPQQPIDLVQGTNNSVLIAYFSHNTNTVMPEGGTDAITSASITVQEDESTVGNTQMIADWIAQMTGGDLFAIQTAYTYPHNYDELVAVGEGQDIDGILPKLLDKPLDLAQYSSVYLVYPIWHFTLPAPVRSFLIQNDLGGKTIYAFATNSGSSFGSSIEVIEECEPDAAVVEEISISQRSVPDSEQEVKETVERIMEQTGAQASSESEQRSNEMKNIQISVGSSVFDAELADTRAAREFAQILQNGPVSIEMSDYSGFEKVGPLGQALTSSNTQITTAPGDVMLYNGNQIVMFYGSNTWDYTPIAKVNRLSDWDSALGDGSITAVFSRVKE